METKKNILTHVTLEQKLFFFIFSIGIFLKLIFLAAFDLHYVEDVDSVLAALSWHKIWCIVPSQNSLLEPLHFYLLGILFKFFSNLSLVPLILNLIFTSLTLVVFYFFVIEMVKKDEKHESIALISLSILIFHPYHIKNSLIASSSSIYHFFIFLSLFCFLKFLNSDFKKRFLFLISSAVLLNLVSLANIEGVLFCFVCFVILIFTPKARLHSLYFLPSSIISFCFWLWIIYFFSGERFSSMVSFTLQGTLVKELFDSLKIGFPYLILGIFGVGYAFYQKMFRKVALFIITFVLLKLFFIHNTKIEMLSLLVIPYAVYALFEICNKLEATRKQLILFVFLSFWVVFSLFNAVFLLESYCLSPDFKEMVKNLNKNSSSGERILIDQDQISLTSILLYSDLKNKQFLYMPWRFEKVEKVMDQDELLEMFFDKEIDTVVMTPLLRKKVQPIINQEYAPYETLSIADKIFTAIYHNKTYAIYKFIKKIEDKNLLEINKIFDIKKCKELKDKGEIKYAISRLKNLIKIYPKNAKIYYEIGSCYEQLEQQDKRAEGYYMSALKIDPFYYKSWMALGHFYRSQHKLKESRDSLKKALRIKPDHPRTYGWLGFLYMLHFINDKNYLNYFLAKEALKKAAHLNPTDHEYYNILGELFYLKGNFKFSKKYLLKSLTLSEEKCDNSLYYLGLIYKNNSEFNLAQKYFKEAIKWAPFHSREDTKRYQSALDELMKDKRDN